jgi:hypothetical protein
MSFSLTRTHDRRTARRRNPFRLAQFRPAAPFGGTVPADRDRERVVAQLRALGAPGDLVDRAKV